MPGKKKKAPQTSSNLVDEQLERYREMRDFSKTAEPSGKEHAASTAKTRVSSVRYSEACGHAPALRFSPGIARGAEKLGGD